jgi:methylenetetrahydrofolate dehydrogenase (NADP+)/methenyltetrahydrofolate cyclohydrolase
MVIVFDGRKRQEEILNSLKNDIDYLKRRNIIPNLAIIDATNNESSKIFIKQKINALKKLSLSYELYNANEADEKNLIELIKNLNENERVNGILVQLPLPPKFNTERIINQIDPLKDVDGLTSYNLGNLMHGKEEIAACTPKAIIDILECNKIDVEAKEVTIVNNSIVVGKPLAMMLTRRFATVSICHVKTRNLEEYTKKSEILITATGVANLIKNKMVKDEAIVIDAGISRVNNMVKGDVDFENVKNKCKLITPVPGGVGPVTVAMVVKNLINCCKSQLK